VGACEITGPFFFGGGILAIIFFFNIFDHIIQRINEEKMWGNSHTLCKNSKRASEEKPPTFQAKSSAVCREILSEDERPV
jgi:hypothetical protein